MCSGCANWAGSKAAPSSLTIAGRRDVASGDPVGRGLVASLARPGGNVTGLSIQLPELAGKRLGLLHEVVPGLRRLAVMANVGAPNAVLEVAEAQAAARTLGLEVAAFEIRRAEDFASTFDALKGRADALYVCGDALVVSNRVRINTLALGARMPTVYFSRDLVESGGLMSYGANFPDMWRRTAELVDNDIPIEQPTKFDLVINLTTARALDLTIPESFLSRADEVIE